MVYDIDLIQNINLKCFASIDYLHFKVTFDHVFIYTGTQYKSCKLKFALEIRFESDILT